MDENRFVDYFIVAGLPPNRVKQDLLQNDTFSVPCGDNQIGPIVDIAVINRSLGEEPPPGYKCVEFTPTGLSANLNHGSRQSPDMFICYRRGRDKPLIVDISVIYEPKEQADEDACVIRSTPGGLSANVNNAAFGSESIFITYRRADAMADCNTLAVVDICVIIPSKKDYCPNAFCRIDKTLSKGMFAPNVYLCYKKSLAKMYLCTHTPEILGRYPLTDYAGFALPAAVAMFCLPMGASVECWWSDTHHPLPVQSAFVLTSDTGLKMYGAAIIFYEDHDEITLTEAQCKALGVKSMDGQRVLKLYQNKSICFLSRWPFFDAMRSLLLYIYRISVSGPQPVPIERYIGHYMTEVPFPSSQKPRIFIQLNTKTVVLSQPEDTALPRSGASFITLLTNLGPDNCITLLLYALLEHKLLIHSLRPDVLTRVAEALTSILFPFRWPFPYVPLCPMALADVLDSPTPVIIGIDSRYFEVHDPPCPPPDVTIVDLDNNTIVPSSDKSSHSAKLLPKKSLKLLKMALEELYDRIVTLSSAPEAVAEISSLTLEITRSHRMMKLEMSIQEAFLRFMASLLKGYAGFLRPILKVPTISTESATDVRSLFNIEGFLRSSDRSSQPFYRSLMKTLAFCHFIEERSFGTVLLDADGSRRAGDLAFFDECIAHLDEQDSGAHSLIDFDETLPPSPLTVIVMPPEPVQNNGETVFSFSGFENLQPQYFLPGTPGVNSMPKNVPLPGVQQFNILLKRTKQEVKYMLREIVNCSRDPQAWAKCLVWYSYSVWFMHLSSYLHVNKRTASDRLHEAFSLLMRMHKLQMHPMDEMCYRALMHQCGRYNQPALAVKVFLEMRRLKLTPNAVTYGVYNKVILESHWRSKKTNGEVLWRRLQHVIRAIACFKAGLPRRTSLDETARSSPFTGPTEHDGSSLATSGYGSMMLGEGSTLGDAVSAAGLHHRTSDEISKEAELADIENVRDVTITDATDIGILTIYPVANSSWEEAQLQNLQRSICRQHSKFDVIGSHPVNSSSAKSDHGGDVSDNAPNALTCAPSSESSALDMQSGGKMSHGAVELRVYPRYVTRDMASDLAQKSKSLQELHTDPKMSKTDRADEQLLTVSRVSELKSSVDELRRTEAEAVGLVRRGSLSGAMQKAATAVASRYRGLRDTLKAASADWLNSPGQGNAVAEPLPSVPLEPGTAASSHSTLDQLVLGEDDVSDAGSVDAAKMRESELFSEKIAERIDICSASKCPNCNNLLYDEEIMAGWSTDDSNLKTSCAFCGHQFLASLYITVFDFRHVHAPPSKNDVNASRESLLGSSSGSVLGRSRDTLLLDASLNSSHTQTADDSKLHDDDDDDDDNSPSVLRYSINVPYLSPIVLRKEMEAIVEQDGEDCLNNVKFLDNHGDIFWNLVWYFKRLGLPSHIEGYVLTAAAFNYQALPPPSWRVASRRHVSVRALWDSPHTHNDFGPPMYVQWQWQHAPKISKSDNYLLFNKSLMQQIITNIMCNNVLIPIQKIVAERNKNRTSKSMLPYRSLYRDILFLTFVVLGQINIDVDSYDAEFHKTLKGLANRTSESVRSSDRPPDIASVHCRQLFGELEL